GHRADRDLGSDAECLQHDAVTLGQLQQYGQLIGTGFGVELEGEPDPLEADRHIPVDPECAPEIDVPFDVNHAATDVELERGGHGTQRHTRARGQGFEQHVPRAQLAAVTTGRL